MRAGASSVGGLSAIAERAFPVIYGFDRAVEVTRRFDPLDLIGAVAGRKDRPDFDGYRIRLGPLERRIAR